VDDQALLALQGGRRWLVFVVSRNFDLGAMLLGHFDQV